MSRRHRWAILALIGCILIVGSGWAVYAWLFVDLPTPGELYDGVPAPSSKILDRHGQLLYEVIDPHLGKHTPLVLDQIPLPLQQATVATEDARFYSNPGVELRGILRAIWINLRGGTIVSGGSTITQQVARNVLFTPEERAERTMTRKLREAILAWRLARTYTKDEILTLYLNETYYGNMAYGVQAAAHAYFRKDANELDLAECTLLAGLPQAPSLYNPLIDLEAARQRQRTVLDLMVQEEYLTLEQANRAASEPLQFASAPFDIYAPHFVTYVWSTLERELGVETMARGGYEIHTTLDLDLQERGEAIIRHQLDALQVPGGPDRNVNNAALLALAPQSGEILAMVGSADYFDASISGAVNSTLSLRQPGSAIKPLTYAAAFDPAWQQRAEADTPWGALPFTPATMLVDVRTSFVTREGVGYVPLNYDLRWHGPVLLREALGSSYNLPAVKVVDAIGVESLVEQAQRMGITSFEAATDRFGRALTLGGGEVTMMELAAAYGVFATGGNLVAPTGVRRVVNEARETVYAAHIEQQPVLDPRVAYLITDILADEWARLPSFGEQSALYLGRPAAAKTGTTTDWRDNWTVGYTPDLVTAVWVGNADNAPMYHVSGITGAGPIWHDFMTWALKGRPPVNFEQPGGLIEVEVCALTGKLPNPYCTHRHQELFIAGTEPTEECDAHQLIPIDTATGLQATEETPEHRIHERVYTVYPPEAVSWAAGQGIPQPPPAPAAAKEHTPGEDMAPVANVAQEIQIVSPFQMDRYRISNALPREDQQIMIEARPGGQVAFASVTLYVNGEPLGTYWQAPYRLWWQLEPGRHEIYAIGETAGGQEYQSENITLIVDG